LSPLGPRRRAAAWTAGRSRWLAAAVCMDRDSHPCASQPVAYPF